MLEVEVVDILVDGVAIEVEDLTLQAGVITNPKILNRGIQTVLLLNGVTANRETQYQPNGT